VKVILLSSLLGEPAGCKGNTLAIPSSPFESHRSTADESHAEPHAPIITDLP
jgi:hypothetical protein